MLKFSADFFIAEFITSLFYCFFKAKILYRARLAGVLAVGAWNIEGS
jgi:hypothetical protein